MQGTRVTSCVAAHIDIYASWCAAVDAAAELLLRERGLPSVSYWRVLPRRVCCWNSVPRRFLLPVVRFGRLHVRGRKVVSRGYRFLCRGVISLYLLCAPDAADELCTFHHLVAPIARASDVSESMLRAEGHGFYDRL